MKVLFFSFLFFTSVATCLGQESDIRNLTKINFFHPGISQELRVAKLQSVHLQAFMNTSAYFSASSSLGTHGGVYFDPALALQYRYYYNSAARAARGKRTEMNNLNYFSGVLQTVWSDAAITDEHVTEEKRRPVNTVGAVWGLQRNGLKRFSLDLNLGIGYMFAKGTKLDFNTGSLYSSPVSRLTTIGQLSLGFWLNKRK